MNMKKDLSLWLQFFRDFNGVSVFHDRLGVANEDIPLFTDSSGCANLGLGHTLEENGHTVLDLKHGLNAVLQRT